MLSILVAVGIVYFTQIRVLFRVYVALEALPPIRTCPAVTHWQVVVVVSFKGNYVSTHAATPVHLWGDCDPGAAAFGWSSGLPLCQKRASRRCNWQAVACRFQARVIGGYDSRRSPRYYSRRCSCNQQPRLRVRTAHRHSTALALSGGRLLATLDCLALRPGPRRQGSSSGWGGAGCQWGRLVGAVGGCLCRSSSRSGLQGGHFVAQWSPSRQTGHGG
jgi:hypothetical protein